VICLKGISSIFSTLIVIIITISLVVPLYLYFYNLYNINRYQINNQYSIYLSKIETKVSVINLNFTSNGIFIYNYGNYPVNINKIIIGSITYHVNYTLYPGEITTLYNILHTNIYINGNSTIILSINDNYYYYQV